MVFCMIGYLATTDARKSTTALRTSTCKDASTIFREVYDVMIDEFRRGAPNSIVTAFYAEFQSGIGQWVQSNLSSNEPLGSQCIPNDVYADYIDNDGRLLSFLDAINYLEQNQTPPSYLSLNEYPSLPRLSKSTERRIDAVWSGANLFLSQEAKPVYQPDFQMFPSDFDEIVVDPNKKEACVEFNHWNSENSTTLDAVALTRWVLKLVVRIYLKGVPQEKAFQILRHHSSYVLNGIRCTEKEGRELQVPTGFVGIYASLAGTLVKQVHAEASMGGISIDEIADVYSDIIASISTYQSWGTPGMFKLVNGSTDYATWKDIIFDAMRVDRITVYEESQGTVSTRCPCTSGYIWEMAMKWSFSVEETCCSEMCYGDVFKSDLLSDSFLQCCQFCNQASCTGSHELYDDYVSIVPQFGDFKSKTISVLI